MNTKTLLSLGFVGATLLGCDSAQIVGTNDGADGGGGSDIGGGAAGIGGDTSASGGGTSSAEAFSVLIDVEHDSYELTAGTAQTSFVAVTIIDGTLRADQAAAPPALGCVLNTEVEPAPVVPAAAAATRAIAKAAGRDPVELVWDGGVLQGEFSPPLAIDATVTVEFQGDSSVLAGEAFTIALDPVEFQGSSYLSSEGLDVFWTPRPDQGSLTVFHLDGAELDQAAVVNCELALSPGIGSVPSDLMAQVVGLYDAEQAAREAAPDPSLPVHQLIYAFGRTARSSVYERQGHHVLVRATHRPMIDALFSSDAP